jgi:hypothetical protein
MPRHPRLTKNVLRVGLSFFFFLSSGVTTSFAVSPVLPISSVTPGSIIQSVTQANIDSTICVSGYTKTERPPSSYTTNLKEAQLRTTYSRYKDLNNSDFEEDHLVSLELGGNPSDPKNLWPEPYAGSVGARIKDRIENKLHALVCSQAITLVTAQRAITGNWYAAYEKYIGISKKSPSSQSSTLKKAKSPIDSSGTWPAGTTGKCIDGTYSSAAHHRGMCSRHGGVAVFRY